MQTHEKISIALSLDILIGFELMSFTSHFVFHKSLQKLNLGKTPQNASKQIHCNHLETIKFSH